MRELAVYYCNKCGFYGYYQLTKNTVCPKCNIKMSLLNMGYQDFMNLNCSERDEKLSKEILNSSSPYIKRLLAPHKANNNREIIARLSQRIENLEQDNKKLTDTVDWMHQMIWDLVRKNKLDQEPLDS